MADASSLFLHPAPPTPREWSRLLTGSFILLLTTLFTQGCNDSGGAVDAEAAPLPQARQSLTLTLQPGPEGKDTFISSRPDLVNTGNPDHRLLPALAWTWSGAPGVLRGFIDFDIPPLPAGSNIDRATLVLSADTTGSSPSGHSQQSGSNAWTLQPITSTWEERTVTWNNQPVTDPARAIALPASTSNAQAYQVDVTAHVITRLENPALMRGWMLRLQTEQHYRAIQFATGDHPSATLRPRLVIEYATSAGSISGRVTRGSCSFNCGIDGVRVDAGNGHSAITAGGGRYVLSNLPLGTYTVRASLPGSTFGSFAYQNANYTVTLTQPGQTVMLGDIHGWSRDPVIFVHGWTSSPQADFGDVPDELRSAGYFVHDWGQLETSELGTPGLHVNARHVREWVRDARFQTGRDKVILYGQSMGGLVARAYVESDLNPGDVSQLFTFGSPHLGAPWISYPGCLVEATAQGRPGAICQMTPTGMSAFNEVYVQRRGVDYHLVAGDAPMWRMESLFCIRIFRRRFCAKVVPVPDPSFRNPLGWAMGLLIPGSDDGFIATASASGLPGTHIDRFITREVHSRGLVGYRDYHDWNGGLSQEGFAQCASRVLLSRNTRTCGSRITYGPRPHRGLFSKAAAEATSDEVPSATSLDQASRADRGILLTGGRKVRPVLIEGGPTAFSASWEAGSARFTLIDPNGKVFDPAYVDSIADDPNDPEAEVVMEPHPDMVILTRNERGSAYYFPAARPGTWQLVLEAENALPPAGTAYVMRATFDSPLSARFVLDRLAYEPGRTARLRVSFSEPVSSAEVQVRVSRPDGAVETVPLERVSATEYAADYVVPGPAGYAALEWSVTGQRVDGIAFERGGQESVQFNSAALRLASGHTDLAIPRDGAPGLHSALVVHLKVRSDYGEGELGVFAELVAPDGTPITRTMVSVPARQGENDVELSFRAEDIFASKADGPYSVRNVKLLDMRGAPLFSQEVALAHTTAAYPYRGFALTPGTPAVFVVDGPYRVLAGGSVTLTATGADPEGDALTFAWDLDGDGVFETAGQTVLFTASSQQPPSLRTVRVQVLDPSGHSAVAETTLEVFANQPPVVLCRNVTVLADAACSGCDSVNDGSYDPDTGGAITCVQTPGCPYVLGSQQVTLTCSDASGLSSSCTATVTVRDVTPPSITCPAGPTLECAARGASASFSPGAVDNCGPVASTCEPPSGTTFPLGTTPTTCTAVDSAGLRASCSFPVTVRDTQPPGLTCPAPLILDSSGPDGALVTPAEAGTGDSCSAVTVSGPSAGMYPNGTTPVTYTATDASGNVATCSTFIEVIPRPPPQLTMCNLPRYTREPTQKVCGWTTPGDSGAAVGRVVLTVDGGAPIPLKPDASGGFVNTWLELAEGTHQLELLAVDVLGGFARRQMTVTVDRTPPLLAVLSPEPDAVLANTVVEVTSAVQDATPTTVVTQWMHSTQVESGTGVVTHQVDLVNPGFSPLLVFATDAAGNTTEVLRHVQVREASPSQTARLTELP